MAIDLLWSSRAGWAAFSGVIALVLGSFWATVAIRWPRDQSVLAGRSRCDQCGTVIAWFDLVPLFSALALRGRCRHCRQPIDRRHLAIEAACGLFGCVAGWLSPGAEGLLAAALGGALIALAALDLVALWLPDALVALVVAGGIGAGLAGFAPPIGDRLIGGVAGFAALWSIATLFRRVRGYDGLGDGDVKLFGAIGVWLGWQALPLVLASAALGGLGAVAVASLAGRRVARDEPLPFGALLAMAAVVGWAAAHR